MNETADHEPGRSAMRFMKSVELDKEIKEKKIPSHRALARRPERLWDWDLTGSTN